MKCKVEAVLKRNTAKERRKGSSKYQNLITDVVVENDEDKGSGGLSSVASLFLNYIESSKE